MAKKFIDAPTRAKFVQSFREALYEHGGATDAIYIVEAADGLAMGVKVNGGFPAIGNMIMEFLGRT